MSVVSVGEIAEFEDYIPFRPHYGLEEIEEEPKEIPTKDYKILFKEQTLREARMSEEESFDSKKESSDDDKEEDKDELVDDISDKNISKPKKSSTITSSQYGTRNQQFYTKLSTLYRQGTGNSEFTIGNNSQKNGVLTSIRTSKDGSQSEALVAHKNQHKKLNKKFSMHFPSSKLKSKNTLRYISSRSSTNSKMLSVSGRLSGSVYKLGLNSQQIGYKSNNVLFISHSQRQIANAGIKDLIIILSHMGFDKPHDQISEDNRKSMKSISQIESSQNSRIQTIIKLFQNEVRSIEEAMYFLVPNKEGLWEHKFIPESYYKAPEYCIVCKRNNDQNIDKKENNSDHLPPGIDGFNKFGDLENTPLTKNFEDSRVINLKDKRVMHNRAYLNRSFISQNNSNKTSYKNSTKNKIKNSRNSMLPDNDITEENANIVDENYEKTSHQNFDLSEKYDDLMMYQEMNENKELFTNKHISKGEDSPKS